MREAALRAACALVLLAAAAGAARAAAPLLQVGALGFAPCEVGRVRALGAAGISAHCATFEVPEDADQPGGRRIGLRVAFLRSEAEPADADVVTFLDGGPGQAATEDWAALARAFERLRKRHNILLVDERGTGGSNALRCGGVEEQRGRRVPGAREDTPEEIRRGVRECLDRLAGRADPRFYATMDAVRDLEAVRTALGIAQFDLVGVSYGTLVAQQYAKSYPAAVRSIVLDSPVPAAHALTSEHASNLEDVLRATLAHCARQPGCAARYGDPYRALRALQAELRAHPRMVTYPDAKTGQAVRRPLDEATLALVVRLYAYSADWRALLPWLVLRAREGDAAPLLANASMIEDALGGLADSGFALSATVVCTEDADLFTDARSQEGTLLGTQFHRFAREVCPLWPHRAPPAAFHEPLRGAIPTLVLSGEFDPVTPPRYGAAIVRELTQARQIVLPGQGHSMMAIGCASRLVAEFVDHLQPRLLDDACLKVLGETPFLLDASGAAP
jgi:pimeloyl-ACP methyl ester carboxylesterase